LWEATRVLFLFVGLSFFQFVPGLMLGLRRLNLLGRSGLRCGSGMVGHNPRHPRALARGKDLKKLAKN